MPFSLKLHGFIEKYPRQDYNIAHTLLHKLHFCFIAIAMGDTASILVCAGMFYLWDESWTTTRQGPAAQPLCWIVVHHRWLADLCQWPVSLGQSVTLWSSWIDSQGHQKHKFFFVLTFSTLSTFDMNLTRNPWVRSSHPHKLKCDRQNGKNLLPTTFKTKLCCICIQQSQTGVVCGFGYFLCQDLTS